VFESIAGMSESARATEKIDIPGEDSIGMYLPDTLSQPSLLSLRTLEPPRLGAQAKQEKPVSIFRVIQVRQQEAMLVGQRRLCLLRGLGNSAGSFSDPNRSGVLPLQGSVLTRRLNG